MSLVNEALKKARMEASRQDALRRGIPLPPPSFFETRRRRAVWPWVALSATGLIALGGLGFWAGQRSARQATAASTSGIEALAAPAVAADEGAEEAARLKAAAPSPAEPEPRAAAASPPVAPTRTFPTVDANAASTSTRLPASTSAPRAAASEPPAAPAAARPATTTPRTQPAVPTYVEIADLPGGRLELGGIAWSKSDPHALINGRILGRGERVESYTIVDIQPREVKLTGDQGSFILRLH